MYKLIRGNSTELQGEALIYSLCYLPMQNTVLMKDPLFTAIYVTDNIEYFLRSTLFISAYTAGIKSEDAALIRSLLSKKQIISFTASARQTGAIAGIIKGDIIEVASQDNVAAAKLAMENGLFDYIMEYAEQQDKINSSNSLDSLKVQVCKICNDMLYKPMYQSWLEVPEAGLKQYIQTEFIAPIAAASVEGLIDVISVVRDDFVNFMQPSFPLEPVFTLVSCASRKHEDKKYEGAINLHLELISAVAAQEFENAVILKKEIEALKKEIGF